MLVVFLSAKVSSPLNSRAIAAAMAARYPIKRHYTNWYVEVPDWTSWLRCVWHAFADLSRGCNAEAMKRTYYYNVHLDNGSIYQVRVFYSTDDKGLHYGQVD